MLVHIGQDELCLCVGENSEVLLAALSTFWLRKEKPAFVVVSMPKIAPALIWMQGRRKRRKGTATLCCICARHSLDDTRVGEFLGWFWYKSVAWETWIWFSTRIKNTPYSFCFTCTFTRKLYCWIPILSSCIFLGDQQSTPSSCAPSSQTRSSPVFPYMENTFYVRCFIQVWYTNVIPGKEAWLPRIVWQPPQQQKQFNIRTQSICTKFFDLYKNELMWISILLNQMYSAHLYYACGCVTASAHQDNTCIK